MDNSLDVDLMDGAEHALADGVADYLTAYLHPERLLNAVKDLFQAIELLLKLAGIEGEAERAGFEKQIQLDSFDWGFHNSSSPTGAGAGAGKVEAHGIQCTKRVDKSSPKLFQAITTGKHFPNAVLTALKAGGDKAVDYMKIECDTLCLVDLNESGSSGDNDVPRETINFTFGKVTVTYNEQKADGTKGAATVASYDFKKHVAG